jgi:hypothetical protein
VADEVVGALPLLVQTPQVRCNFFPKSRAAVVKVGNPRGQLVEPRHGPLDRFCGRSLTKIGSSSCHGAPSNERSRTRISSAMPGLARRRLPSKTRIDVVHGGRRHDDAAAIPTLPGPGQHQPQPAFDERGQRLATPARLALRTAEQGIVQADRVLICLDISKVVANMSATVHP